MTLPLLPAVLPILPREKLPGSWVLRANEGFAEECGWPELVSQVGDAQGKLTPEEMAQAAIFTVNYGEAGALELLGRSSIKLPVISAHNSHWLWGPGANEPQTLIIVGARHTAWMEKFYGRVEKVGTINNALGIRNEEQGGGIFMCREPKGLLRDAWPELNHFQ